MTDLYDPLDDRNDDRESEDYETDEVAEDDDEDVEEVVDETIASMLAQIQELTQQRDQLTEQLARALADFQNYRRRIETEKQALRNYAVEGFVGDLLPVLDTFDRALESLTPESNVEQVKTGIEGVQKMLLGTLSKHKVVKIEAAGQPFDPDVHEALVMEPSAEHPDMTVLEELSPGYKLVDRVIRPARVKVSKSA